MQNVLLTDCAWPDVDIERAIVERAGFRLVTGSSSSATAEVIAQMVRDHQPAAILTRRVNNAGSKWSLTPFKSGRLSDPVLAHTTNNPSVGTRATIKNLYH